MSAFTERLVFNEAMRAAAVYHADEGTSGWLLSEARFDAILAAADAYRADGLLSLAAELEAATEAPGRDYQATYGFQRAAILARERAGVDPDAAEHAPVGHDKASHAQAVSDALSPSPGGAP